MTKTKSPAKRYGHHQKHTAHFMRTYWPYMPLTLIVGAMLLLSFGTHKIGRGVLSYATDVTNQELLDDTNQQRLQNDVPALHLNSKLSEAAQAKANDMASRNYWSHNTPDGNPPWIFINKVGYAYQKAGENLAYGFATSGDTVIGWMNSPPHRENLLDKSFEDVGFGYANVANYQNKGNETIVVAMYGEPRITLAATSDKGISLSHALPGISTLGASTNQPNQEPGAHRVAVAQLLTGGRLPWINAAIVVLGVIGVFILLMRHSFALHRTLIRGERFALHHPLFDVTVVSFLGLCLMLGQAAGMIR